MTRRCVRRRGKQNIPQNRELVYLRCSIQSDKDTFRRGSASLTPIEIAMVSERTQTREE